MLRGLGDVTITYTKILLSGKSFTRQKKSFFPLLSIKFGKLPRMNNWRKKSNLLNQPLKQKVSV